MKMKGFISKVFSLVGLKNNNVNGCAVSYSGQLEMPCIIFVFAAIFVALGGGSYVLTGAQSWTALIPAIFGLLLGIAWLISKKSVKYGGYFAAIVGLLGFLGTFRSFSKIPALLSGQPVARPTAVAVQALFAILSLVLIGLWLKALIGTRRSDSQI